MAKKKKKSSRKGLYIIIIIIIIAAFSYLKYFRNSEESSTSYVTTELLTTTIESIVSSTGTLAAVGTVEIGTQVSGRIDSVMADFNDHVKENEILAILDRTTLKLTYTEAQAKLRNVEAQYELTREQYENDSKLYEKGMISEYEYLSSETNLTNAETNLTSARISLEKADKNLNEYAIIRAPIDGLIISREIEEGQTVSASMSAPTLFVMAEDLNRMEIEALVDESDIGMIEEGQQIRFTVEAYVDEEFTGNVEQVRMQPSVVSNVVNYTVICSADNSSGLLLPGMTATIDFVIDTRENVTAITNSALSVELPMSVLQEMRGNMKRPEKGDRKPPATMQRPTDSERENDDTEMGRIWYLDSEGKIGMSMVKVGLSDGINTEITLVRDIPEGSKIIKKVRTSGETTTTSDSQNSRRMGPPGPGLF